MKYLNFQYKLKSKKKYYLCSHHSLSFCNQRTLRTKTLPVTTLSFVSPQPRNQAMISTPSTLRPPLFQLTFCLLILHFFTLSTQHNHSLIMIHKFIHFNLSNIPILLVQKKKIFLINKILTVIHIFTSFNLSTVNETIKRINK